VSGLDVVPIVQERPGTQAFSMRFFRLSLKEFAMMAARTTIAIDASAATLT
jgi:hypothetical protein